MRVIKSILVIFISALLFVAFVGLKTFATLNSSLDYEIMKPKATAAIKNMLTKEYDLGLIEQNEDYLKQHCKNNSEFTFQINSNESFSIPCEIINNGTEAIINYEAGLFFDKIYYKTYKCEFWQCFEEAEKEGLFFLISLYSKNYWKKLFYQTLLVCIILSILIFLFMKTKNNFPMHIGILLIASFIPVFGFFPISKIIPLKNELFLITNLFFSQEKRIFLTALLIGLFLIGLTIFLKLLKIEIKIEKFFRKK